MFPILRRWNKHLLLQLSAVLKVHTECAPQSGSRNVGHIRGSIDSVFLDNGGKPDYAG